MRVFLLFDLSYTLARTSASLEYSLQKSKHCWTAGTVEFDVSIIETASYTCKQGQASEWDCSRGGHRLTGIDTFGIVGTYGFTLPTSGGSSKVCLSRCQYRTGQEQEDGGQKVHDRDGSWNSVREVSVSNVASSRKTTTRSIVKELTFGSV